MQPLHAAELRAVVVFEPAVMLLEVVKGRGDQVLRPVDIIPGRGNGVERMTGTGHVVLPLEIPSGVYFLPASLGACPLASLRPKS